MLKSFQKTLQSQRNKNRCHSWKADPTLSGKETRLKEVLKKICPVLCYGNCKDLKDRVLEYCCLTAIKVELRIG